MKNSVVNFYNGEYPELYQKELIKDKKTQDKKEKILNKIYRKGK